MTSTKLTPLRRRHNTKQTAGERARLYIAKIPGAVSGQGGHDATFKVACAAIHGFGLGEGEALELLREFSQRCDPPWSEKELIHKVRSAAAAPSDRPRGYLLGDGTVIPRNKANIETKPKPTIDPTTAVESYLKGFRYSEADLWDASPCRLPDDSRHDLRAVLECLYQPGELLNYVIEFKLSTNKAGETKANPIGHGITIERNELIQKLSLDGVPQSEAGAWWRLNPLNGNGVADCDVTSFRFALLECDAVPLDLQLSLFAKLPLPIAAILTSGGRSLHAWVQVDAPDLESYKREAKSMLEILARFGVDGKNSNPSRLSRLPGAHRRIGAHGDAVQRLIYLNPEPEQRRICGS